MEMRFHSVQMYVHSLRDLSWYKSEEEKYNKVQEQIESGSAGTDVYKQTFGEDPPEFISQGQDIVHQLISGAGWRVRGWNEGEQTRSALVVSSDSRGVKFIVTALAPSETAPAAKKQKTTEYEYFDQKRLAQYLKAQKDRAGVATLCFEVNKGCVDKIKANYKAKHPELVASDASYDDGALKSLTVYAYYLPNEKSPDTGTTLRFIERDQAIQKDEVLPGFETHDCTFAVPSVAYFDHWVSNVFDRHGFMKTLKDCVGFTPKVDFNAGVVAAGEAIIESTVIGNSSNTTATSKLDILVDQSQVYLPINNALSEVGHVHLYLQEIGQGVQHLASRVPDLLHFIARTNKFREATGHGLSFLNIPRSYYGSLFASSLAAIEGVDVELAEAIIVALQEKGLVDETGITAIDITDDAIAALKTNLSAAVQDAFAAKLGEVTQVIKHSRYANLVKLLGTKFTEDTYLGIVRNKILIDIQGKDVLYQIFTSNILQAKPGQESPFLEFIQRVCSEEKDKDGNSLPIRPGCGGFGIRNFLTLFLSIEVNKAMNMLKTARASGDAVALKLAQAQVKTLTAQLDESNPILTAISDAMTAEADAIVAGDKEEAAKWLEKKEQAQQKLKDCSTKYKEMMKALREKA